MRNQHRRVFLTHLQLKSTSLKKIDNFLNVYEYTMNMLACDYRNESKWALTPLSLDISTYPTTIEGTYNMNTYNNGIYNISTL